MTHTFLKSQSGAVTVDWVVLTAGLVGLGLATMAVVSTGTQTATGEISRQLHGTPISTSFYEFEGASAWAAWAVHVGYYDEASEAAGDYAALAADKENYTDAQILSGIAGWNTLPAEHAAFRNALPETYTGTQGEIDALAAAWGVDLDSVSQADLNALQSTHGYDPNSADAALWAGIMSDYTYLQDGACGAPDCDMYANLRLETGFQRAESQMLEDEADRRGLSY